MGEQTSIFKPALVLMAGRAVGATLAFAIPVVLVRVFDPAGFGAYKQLFLVAATLYGIAQLGAAESLYYFLPGERARGARFAANALLVLGASGLGCFALLWWGREPIAQGLNNPALAALLPLLGAFMCLWLPSAVLEIVMTVQNRHRLASGTYAASDLLRAALLVAPAAAWAGLEGLLAGAIAFAALRLAAALVYLRREYGALGPPDAALLARQAAYAAPFALAVTIEMAYANLHLYAVSARVDAATFAVYAVGCLQVPAVDFLMTSTSNVMMVRMRELGARGGAALLALWHDATRKLALVLVPLAGLLIVTADELIALLFTADYAASAAIFRWWTLGMLLAALLTDSALRVFAATRLLLAVNLVRLVLALVALGPCIAAFGLTGAVWATLGAAAVAKLLALARIRALFRCGFDQLLPWRALASIAAVGALAAGPALLLRDWLGGPLLSLLVAESFGYVATYAGLLLAAGVLEPAERAALGDRWRRLRPRADVGSCEV